MNLEVLQTFLLFFFDKKEKLLICVFVVNKLHVLSGEDIV